MMRRQLWGLAALLGGAVVVYRVCVAGLYAVPDLAVAGFFGAALVEFMWAGEEHEQ